MSRQIIDLHMHSTFSDGTATPEELAAAAREAGVVAMALTDHDTVAGVPRLVKAAGALGIAVIPGVELDSSYEYGAMHFLGYGIDPANGLLQEHLAWLAGGARARMEDILGRLNGLGIRITWRDLEPMLPPGDAPGRTHVAEVLIRKGLVRNRQEAFSRFLGTGKPAFVPKRLFDPVACIRLIQESGGVAVLAHPMSLKFSRKDLRRIVQELAERGLEGIEVYYSEAMPDAEKTALGLAREFNLVATGGSDYHGSTTPGVTVGRGAGGLHVPVDLLTPLVARIAGKSGAWLPKGF